MIRVGRRRGRVAVRIGVVLAIVTTALAATGCSIIVNRTELMSDIILRVQQADPGLGQAEVECIVARLDRLTDPELTDAASETPSPAALAVVDAIVADCQPRS